MTASFINLLDPTSGEDFGVGFRIRVNWAGVGPVLNPVWIFFLQDTDGTKTVAQTSKVVSTPTEVADLPMSNQQLIGPLTGDITEGANARLRVELHGQSGLVDALNIPVKYRAPDGGTVLLQQSQPVSGFTPADRDLLNQILAAVRRQLHTSA